MSHKTDYKIPFFSSPQTNTPTPTPPTPQQPGMMGRIWNGTKWAVGGTLWGASRPIAWAFSPIGDGLGSGLVSGAKKEIEQMVQPEGPLGIQLKETLEQALMRQPPAELLALKGLLAKAINTPDSLTQEDLIATHTYMKLLSDNDNKLLKQLAPDLNQQGIQSCALVFRLIKETVENEHFVSEPGHRDEFVVAIKKNPAKDQIADFNEILTMVLNRNQGALIQSLGYLQQALLSEESGVLNQAVELLKKKCTDENTGLMKQVVVQLNDLLTKNGGTLDLLSHKLSGSEESIISKAVLLLQTKLLDKEGIVDQLGKKFNDQETGIIAQALNIAKGKFDEILKDSLLLLRREMTEETGLLNTMKQKLSGKDGVLEDAIRLLNESLFKEETGTVARLRSEINDKERGILTEALKRLAKALNDDKEGILSQGMDLLRQKLTSDKDGILTDAIRLLEHKLNGPEGVIEKLQHRLLNENDGTLTKALTQLQTKLNDEKTGILSQSLALLEQRLLADNGLVDSLGKKLTHEETGVIAQAILSLKVALEKKEGPLDILDQRLQLAITNALKILHEKCLDDKEGILTKMLGQLQEKLNHEKTGILTQSLALLEHRLLAENGLVDNLGKKLTDEESGVLAKAVLSLKVALEKKDGPLDILDIRLQKAITDALGLLQTKCLDEKDGLLTTALARLQEKLNDEKTGILTQSLGLLEKRLLAENGLIDNLSKKLSDEETGVLSHAVKSLKASLEKKDGPLDLLDQRLQKTLTDALAILTDKCLNEQDGLVSKTLSQLQEKLNHEETGILAHSVALLEKRLLAENGLIDSLGKKLTHEESGVLTKALALFQEKLNDEKTGVLAKSVDLLEKRLMGENGLVDSLSKKLFEGEEGILAKAVKGLKESLEKTDGPLDLLDARLQKTLSDALALMTNKCLDEKEGLLSKALSQLQEKLNHEQTGILAQSIGLLEKRLLADNGLVDSLGKKLTNEENGVLTQAIALFQQKLNDEKTGVLAKSVELLEKRLLAENGLIDTLGKKLTDEKTGILTQAVESLKLSLEKKDGPLDLLDQRLQKTLADAMVVLSKKCLDEKDGLIAQALTLFNEKLNAENGLLDTLSKRLNDPHDGIVAKAITSLNLKLTEKDGTFDLLEKRLLDESTGLLPKAIALLTTKLQENVAAIENQLLKEGGTVDKATKLLHARLVDKEGILDQAMNLLDDRLNHNEKGLLAKAKKYLSDTLTDEKEGIVAKAIDLLNAKLRAKDGPIDYLEFRLTDKDAGILSKAADVLQQKLMSKGGVVDELDQRLTGQAHPLLSKTRNSLTQLRQAIIASDKKMIAQHSKALNELLGQLETQQTLVFTKAPLDSSDLSILQNLRSRLAQFYGTTPPSQSDMLLAVEGGLGAIDRYHGSYSGIAERTGTILRDTITDALDPILRRVERLPNTMVDNLLGRNSTEQTPGSTNPSDQEEGTVSQFLAQGGSILKTILEKGSKAVSKQALSSFAGALKLGLNQVIGKMDDSEPFRQVKATLMQTVSALEQVANGEGGNWNDLHTQIQNASRALSGVKIYVNGFRIPKIGPTSSAPKNAEALFSENMNALHEAIDAPSPQPQAQEWKRMAESEQKKLVRNTTDFLTIRHIFENVCKLKPTDEKFYVRMMNEAKKKGKESDKELKKLLFEELGRRKVSFFTRISAQIQYFFYEKIVRRLTRQATKAYFEQTFKYIEQHKADNFESLRDQLLTNATRYLTVLGGAYKKIAKNPAPTGTINEMLSAEMEKKESNMGFERSEIYADLAHDVIKKSTGSGLFSWFAKKLIGNPEAIIRTVIDKTAGSVQDTQGYTHALNSVIREQLDEVWRLLQEEISKSGNGGVPDAFTEVSQGKKAQLAGLLKNLFEILRKSQCKTVDELRDLIKGKKLSANIHGAIDDLFIEDVIEKVTNILAVTIQTLVKEDHLQKLTYKFANLANRTFEIGEEVTIEEMQEEERKIALRSEQILRLAINTAVEEKFDFSGKKQQKETNGFINELHTRSQAYFASAAQDLQALATMDIASPEGKNKTNKLIEEAMAYESECFGSSFQAKGSKINSDSKDEIRERYYKIAEASKPFVQAVVQLKQHARTLENLNAAIPHLNQIKLIIPALALRAITNPAARLEDIDFASNQIRIVETHLEELKKMRINEQHIELLFAQTRAIALTLVTLRKAIQTRTLGTNLAQPNSLIDQIAAEKTQHLGQLIENPTLTTKFAMLKEELALSVNATLLPQLLSKLDQIKNATIRQQVDTARQEFLRLLRGAVDQANLVVGQERQKYETAFRSINEIIDQTNLLDPNREREARSGLQQSIQLATQHLTTLSQWEANNIRQVPFINFEVVDMKGMQDWAGEIVYGRIKERQEGLFNFIRQPGTIRDTMNHLFFLPYELVLKPEKRELMLKSENK